MNFVTRVKKQTGASLGTVVFNLGLLIFIGFIVAKIGGLYLDNQLLNKTLNSIEEVPYVTKKSRREVRDLVSKRLRSNGLDLTEEEIIVDKQSDRLVIDIVYQRSVPLFGNISALVSFENNIEVIQN